MRLKNLTLTNFRAFNHDELTFQPGMNLIMGINGAGKSTVLDALRILLSQVTPKLTGIRNKAINFQLIDVAVDKEALSANLTFEIAETPFQYLVEQAAEANALPVQRLTPDPKVVSKFLKNNASQALAVYFSPRRALASTVKFNSKLKGQATAFAEALEHRELRLMEFADWWVAQLRLAAEGATNAQRHADAIDYAVSEMLESFGNVRTLRNPFDYKDRNGKVSTKTYTNVLIEKHGLMLNMLQLSDGERGILALALDLTRRLSQANPQLENPCEGEAVVLIDELDLHLHPRWQRTIAQKLTSTFPNCQFIVTTHSPLIIGEVPPSGLILLQQSSNQVEVIQSGLQGFGLDSSWILRHLMETDSRSPISQAIIDKVEVALEEGDLDLARQHLVQLKTMLHGNDDEVIRLEASINNLEVLADAMDTETK